MTSLTSLGRDKGCTSCPSRGRSILIISGVVVGAAATFYVVRVWRRSGQECPPSESRAGPVAEDSTEPSPLESKLGRQDTIEVPPTNEIGDGIAPNTTPLKVIDTKMGAVGVAVEEASEMETEECENRQATMVLQPTSRQAVTTKKTYEDGNSAATVHRPTWTRQPPTDQQPQDGTTTRTADAAAMEQPASRKVTTAKNRDTERAAAARVLQSAWRTTVATARTCNRAAAKQYEERQRLARVEIAQQYVRECAARARVRVSRGERALIRLQARFRGIIVREKLARAKRAVILLQAHARGNALRFAMAQEMRAGGGAKYLYFNDNDEDNNCEISNLEDSSPKGLPATPASHGTFHTSAGWNTEIDINNRGQISREQVMRNVLLQQRDTSNVPINCQPADFIPAPEKPGAEDGERSDQWKTLVSTLDKIAKVNAILPGRGNLTDSKLDEDATEFYLVEGPPAWGFAPTIDGERYLPPFEGLSEGWTVHAPFAPGGMMAAHVHGVSFGDDAREISGSTARVGDTENRNRAIETTEASVEELAARRAKIEEAVATARAKAMVEAHEAHQQQQREHKTRENSKKKQKKKKKDKKRRLLANQKLTKKHNGVAEASQERGDETDAEDRQVTAVVH